MKLIAKALWPYEELGVQFDSDSESFFLSTPWASVSITADGQNLERLRLALKALQSIRSGKTPEAENAALISWMLGLVPQYPFSYILPRAFVDGVDQHKISGDASVVMTSPLHLIQFMASERALTRSRISDASGPLEDMSLHFRKSNAGLFSDWSWDVESDLAIARIHSQNDSFDPYSVFTVARRYHVLDICERNKTAELYAHVQGLKSDPTKFGDAMAFVLRQNHYVTEQCESVLSNALKIAKSAVLEIEDFIASERGHDRLLGGAIEELGVRTQEVDVLLETKLLMDVFAFAGRRNLLAFAMITDIFERSSYQDEDPLATVLKAGGFDAAAALIERHKSINDAGEHESVGLSFLEEMMPVDEAYLTEAMRMTELASLLMSTLSSRILENLPVKAPMRLETMG